MKLTPHKAQWVKDRINFYCKSMKCPSPSLLLLTQAEWKQWADYMKEKTGYERWRTSSKYTLGICDHKRRVIAIFVKNSPNLERMDQTIRHELIHLVRRYNHHSKRFHDLMHELKMGRFTA